MSANPSSPPRQPHSLRKLLSSSSNDAGHPIFSLTSTDSDEKKFNRLRHLFSSSSESPAPDHSPQSVLCHKRSSLVPPNYNSVFPPRHFQIHNFNPKSQWADQLVSVPDNGIRAELTDMYAMFENMERRPLMLSTDDIDLFYEWFAAFYAILDQCFYLEEKCLYAWIEGADQLSEEERKWNPAPNKIEGSLSPAARTKRRGEILRLGFDIRSYRSRFEGRPVLQTLPALADAVDRFVNELVVYLDMKKDLLPSHISSNFNVKHRTKFEKNYWSTAKNMEGPALTIVAATRWMNRRQLRRLKAKYFPSGKYVYSKWNATYFTTHRAIIVEFENRVTQSEAERENQVMLNNMARARAVTDVTDETTETDRQEHQPISRGGSCRSVSYTEYSQGSFHEMVEGNATLPVLGM